MGMSTTPDPDPAAPDLKLANGPPVVVAGDEDAPPDRRKAQRTISSKGAKIFLASDDVVDCTVLDFSDTGAVLEVPKPIAQETLDVAFDGSGSPHRMCRVVWSKESRVGVEFLTMGALLDGYEVAHQRRKAQLAERHRKDEAIDRELLEVIRLMNEAATFLKEKAITFDVSNRTLRIAHHRAPVIAIRYDPEVQRYDITFMPDGSHSAAKDSAGCVKAIGEMIFEILARK